MPLVTVLSQPRRLLCVSLTDGKGKGEEVGFGSAEFPELFNHKTTTFSPRPPPSSSMRCGFSLSGRLLSHRRLASWWLLSWAGYQQEFGDMAGMRPRGRTVSETKAPCTVQPGTEETSLSIDWPGLYR